MINLSLDPCMLGYKVSDLMHTEMIELLITLKKKKNLLLDAANFVASNEIAIASTKGQHIYDIPNLYVLSGYVKG